MSRTFRVEKSLAVSPNKSWLVDFPLEKAEGGSQWEDTLVTKIKEKVAMATRPRRHIASIILKFFKN